MSTEPQTPDSQAPAPTPRAAVRADGAAAVLARLRAGQAEAGPVDLAGARLIGEDLSGLDLSQGSFEGADLSRSNLAGANLFGARLAGAVLFEANLSGAELSGADLSSANLEGADCTRAGLGMANLTGASLVRTDFTGATLTEAVLADAHARLATFDGCRARESDWTDADLSKASLRGAELDGSCVEHASFDCADLRTASLQGLRGYKMGSWIGVDIRDIDFTGAYLCRRFIHDQNFIEEFRSQGRWSELLFKLWRATSDCGRSISRWAFCTFVLMLVFACAYMFVAIDFGDYETPLSPFYFSVVTLTTLGYGDVLPASPAAQVVAVLQVVTGYVMLGGLLSILSNKMARCAD
ncbi:MAG: hypothetical protein GY711_24870 [bacterium]|nr:hypothetical protein [bacterium]